MKRDHSTIADGLANQMYTTLEEGTTDDSNLFSTTVQKFVELPKIAPALGFERDTSAQDIWTISRIIGSIKSAFLGILKTIGPRYLGQRAVAQSTASVCFTEDVPQKCVTKVTGIPETLWKQGGCLADRNACAGCAEMESSIPLSEHADRIPWKVIWEWFHSDDCIKVTEDKQTKRRYSKKKFTLPDYRKTTLQLDCVHRVRNNFSSHYLSKVIFTSTNLPCVEGTILHRSGACNIIHRV